jgi:hypothetical protein
MNGISDFVKHVVVLSAVTILPAITCTVDPPTVPERNPQVLAHISFEEASEIENWNTTSSYGTTIITSERSFEGHNCIEMMPCSSSAECYVIDRKVGNTVKKSTQYRINFSVLIPPSGTDKMGGCIADMYVVVKQGLKELLHENVWDAPDWEEKSFYFETDSDLPISIELWAGRALYLDDLEIVEELE